MVRQAAASQIKTKLDAILLEICGHCIFYNDGIILQSCQNFEKCVWLKMWAAQRDVLNKHH